MKYTPQATEQAEKELNRRKQNAEALHDKRVAEISRLFPQIAALENELAKTRVEILKAISSNNKDHRAYDVVMNVKNKNKQIHNDIAFLLKQNGYPEDYLQYNYTCNKCKDSGYVNGIRCQCMNRLLEKYSSDELSSNCTIALHNFDEFIIDYYPETDGNFRPREKMRENLNGCIEYANNFTEHSSSIFMFGKTGLGKTFLCSCIAKRLIESGYSVVFGSILNLFNLVEAEHFNKKEGNTLDILLSSDLVILDDLGSEFKTGFTESVLYQIINDRLNLDKPTIVSTNLSPSQLNERYNERIVSRLTGCFKPILFFGNDIRYEMRKLGL